MGRPKTMSKEDKQAYCREYYYKTKGERSHEYALTSRRSYLRKKLKELCPSSLETIIDDTKLYDSITKIQAQIDSITEELNKIRAERWNAKREAGGALFKKWDTISEQPSNLDWYYYFFSPINGWISAL